MVEANIFVNRLPYAQRRQLCIIPDQDSRLSVLDPSKTKNEKVRQKLFELFGESPVKTPEKNEKLRKRMLGLFGESPKEPTISAKLFNCKTRTEEVGTVSPPAGAQMKKPRSILRASKKRRRPRSKPDNCPKKRVTVWYPLPESAVKLKPNGLPITPGKTMPPVSSSPSPLYPSEKRKRSPLPESPLQLKPNGLPVTPVSKIPSELLYYNATVRETEISSPPSKRVRRSLFIPYMSKES